jgi:hypothetical protein
MVDDFAIVSEKHEENRRGEVAGKRLRRGLITVGTKEEVGPVALSQGNLFATDTLELSASSGTPPF